MNYRLSAFPVCGLLVLVSSQPEAEPCSRSSEPHILSDSLQAPPAGGSDSIRGWGGATVRRSGCGPVCLRVKVRLRTRTRTKPSAHVTSAVCSDWPDRSRDRDQVLRGSETRRCVRYIRDAPGPEAPPLSPVTLFGVNGRAGGWGDNWGDWEHFWGLRAGVVKLIC